MQGSTRMDTSDAIVEVCPNIFFGPYSYTFTPECLTRFKGVINVCSEESSSSPEVRSKLLWRHWPSRDHVNYPILENHLAEALDFIDYVNGPVYIHCYMGRNRSAAIALAVAIKRTGLPLDFLLMRARLQTSRALLDNTGFIKQLENLT